MSFLTKKIFPENPKILIFTQKILLLYLITYATIIQRTLRINHVPSISTSNPNEQIYSKILFFHLNHPIVDFSLSFHSHIDIEKTKLPCHTQQLITYTRILRCYLDMCVWYPKEIPPRFFSIFISHFADKSFLLCLISFAYL